MQFINNLVHYMITCTPCILLLTRSWTYYACIFSTFEKCFFFFFFFFFFYLVRLPLDFGFDMDLEVDAAVWRSDINPINA